MKKIAAAIITLVCIFGCKRYDIDEVLLLREDISLTIKGIEYLSYEPQTFQLGYNPKKNEFRVFDDNLANWFALTCSSRPSEAGQEVKASLSWTTGNSTKVRNYLVFKVEKIDSNGKIWMWCEDAAIGVVVKELQ